MIHGVYRYRTVVLSSAGVLAASDVCRTTVSLRPAAPTPSDGCPMFAVTVAASDASAGSPVVSLHAAPSQYLYEAPSSVDSWYATLVIAGLLAISLNDIH